MRRWFFLAPVLGLSLLVPRQASAYMYYYSPTFVMPSRLVMNNQYFDFSVGGLEDLCAVQVEACASPQQQEKLSSLSTKRALSWSMIGVGAAAAIAGGLVPIATVGSCQDTGRCDAHLPLLLGLEGGALVLITVGWILAPTSRDLMTFVNMTNTLHPTTPIEIRVGMTDEHPTLALSGHF